MGRVLRPGLPQRLINFDGSPSAPQQLIPRHPQEDTRESEGIGGPVRQLKIDPSSGQANPQGKGPARFRQRLELVIQFPVDSRLQPRQGQHSGQKKRLSPVVPESNIGQPKSAREMMPGRSPQYFLANGGCGCQPDPPDLQQMKQQGESPVRTMQDQVQQLIRRTQNFRIPPTRDLLSHGSFEELIHRNSISPVTQAKVKFEVRSRLV